MKKMKGIRAKGISLCIAALALAGSASPALSRAVHRSIFYSETPFGALAWIKGAQTRAIARGAYTIEDLSTETCLELPKTGRHWFVINHSEADLGGRTGYFAVRIVYSFADPAKPTGVRTGLHLFRNANWFDTAGMQNVKEYERRSEQISLSNFEFTALHDPSAAPDNDNLSRFESAVGHWHMSPDKDQDSSWADRYLYGPMLRSYMQGPDAAISARLIRFTATSGTSSRDPVLFWFDPQGASSATILIDAPRHPETGSHVYNLSFGGPCP